MFEKMTYTDFGESMTEKALFEKINEASRHVPVVKSALQMIGFGISPYHAMLILANALIEQNKALTDEILAAQQMRPIHLTVTKEQSAELKAAIESQRRESWPLVPAIAMLETGDIPPRI